MIALGADAFVRRAVHHAARRALARVFFAGGLLVHAAMPDAVIGTEIRRAHGAPRGASVTDAMTLLVSPLSGTERGPGGEDRMHADHQLLRRTTALRAGENPIRCSRDRSLRREPRASAALRQDVPLDALHQHLRLGELERMHDRHHLMAAHLLRPPPLVQGGDGADVVGIGLVREH